MPNIKSQINPMRLTLTLLAIATAALLQLAPATPAQAAESCPNHAVREQQNATYLPDCRGYERVSPAQKNDEEVAEPYITIGQVTSQAAMEGSAISYDAFGGFPGSLSAGQVTPYLSDSAAPVSPWQTLSLSPESRFADLRLANAGRDISEFRYFSPDLTCGVESSKVPLAMHSGEDQSELPPGESVEEGIENLYAWNAADDSYELVTNIKPESAGSEGEVGYQVDGASANCRHVIFESSGQFLGAPGALYEWAEGTLRVASVLPDGTLPTAGVTATKAGEEGSAVNEISSDGSRVFFTAAADKGLDAGEQEVFMRLDGTSTVEVSASETGVADEGARFQAASKSGEQVFFIANYGLASSSSSGAAKCEVSVGGVSVGGASFGEGCDLYAYNTVTGALSDISADANGEDSTGADVRGVLGIAEEGDVIYFSASGQLVPSEGNTEATNTANDEANVYSYQQGRLSYVASIGAVEATGSGGQTVGGDALAAAKGLVYTASRVSSDGEYLLFATAKPIRQSDGVTYENTDAATDKPDFEDYEYSLASSSVTCVSCDPDGARPRLGENDANLFGEGGQYQETWDLSIPRNLANDGEVYFDTSNPVVPQAINDTVNVYQWQPEGVGSCAAGQPGGCVAILDSGTSPEASYFEGASANGENVYLSTDARLAPEDQDGLRDMYDVREDGGFLYSPPPAGCSGEECQGALPGQEGTQTPGSTLPSGNGNVASTTKTTTTTTKPTLTVVSKKVSGATLKLKLKVSAAGKVTVTGSGVSKVAKTAKGASTLTLKVKLTKAQAAKLTKGRRVKAKLTIAFAPKSGKRLVKKLAVTFKPAKKRRRSPARRA